MKKLLLITAILALALAGCARGPHFDIDGAKTVRVGDTKKQLVKKMDSIPYEISNSDCCEQWTWRYGAAMVSFPIVDGKVHKIPVWPSDQEVDDDE